MIFSSKASPRRQRAASGRLAVAAGLLALALLGSCGGGTEQFATFVPARLIVFGDDTSALTQSGLNYSVNGLGSTGLVNCTVQPIWVQQVASNYGLVFSECNPTEATPTAIMWAEAGAMVADVQAQVVEQIAAGGFRPNDLSTVLAGANDILQLYTQYPGRSLADLSSDAGARGKQLAQAVNQLVGLGVKVIISDVPDQGLSPYAIAQKALDPNVDRSVVLSQLTTAFNQQLDANLVLDGRYVGLVEAQTQFQAISLAPSRYGFSNITTALCTTPIPDCTTATLVAGGTPKGYLWADNTRISPGGQAQLASLAITRIRGNPF
jgi:phospholipase/lecithinase/hemolysin